jgi:signal transduction histidine kinase
MIKISEPVKYFFKKNLWLRVLVIGLIIAVHKIDGSARNLGWLNSFVYILEDFSIIISSCIFIIYYSIRDRLEDFHSHLIGTGFLIVGTLDFYRSLTSPDVIPLFQSATTLLHHELGGLVADSILILMLALVFIPQGRRCKFKVLSYSIPIGIAIVASVLGLFLYHPFFLPDIYKPDIGQTNFYFYSKLTLMFLFAYCSYEFHKKYLYYIGSKNNNDFHSLRLQIKYQNLAIACRLLAAFSLTLTLYDFDNDLNDQLLEIFGHILKTIAFIYVYRAVVKSTLSVPYLENEAISSELQSKIKNSESLELELRNVRKLAAVGQHVDGIAHDMGNLLMMISVSNDKFLESDDYTEVQENVNNIHRTVDKCKSFLSSLIRFTKNIDQPFMKFKFAEHIGEFQKNIEPIISVNNIQLEVQLSCTCELVMVRSDLDQILFNLVFNAKDAIKPNAGKISIFSKLEDVFNKKDVFGLDFIEGKYCCITVSDTGRGIPRDKWQSIFDPFSTSKDDGKNFGLGLSTVLNIINKYQGHIVINSEVGFGTSFSFYLPYDSNRWSSLAILDSKL